MSLSATSEMLADLWMGQRLPEDKPINTFRLTFSNINSLGSNQYNKTIQQLAETRKSLLGIDYLGITEHCLQPNVMRTIHNSLRQHYLGQYVPQMNYTSHSQQSSPNLPGGTHSSYPYGGRQHQPTRTQRKKRRHDGGTMELYP